MAELRAFLADGGPALAVILALSVLGWSSLLWMLFERATQPSSADADPVEREIADWSRRDRAVRERLLLRFVGTLAVVTPLLGLLGTVGGMMRTFGSLDGSGTPGGGDVDGLAGGISQALVTTQAGLVVALSLIGGRLWLSRSATQREAR